MRQFVRASLAWAAFAALSSILPWWSASATVTYSYMGDYFDFVSTGTTYTSSQRITGHIVVDEPLGPFFNGSIRSRIVSYSFDDGFWSMNESNSVLSSSVLFLFATDASGDLVRWDLRFEIPFPAPTKVGDEAGGITIFGATDFDSTSNRAARIYCIEVQSDVCTLNTQEVGMNTIAPGGVWTVEVSHPRDAMFMGLGDLPGGMSLSFATRISSDGSTVVGASSGKSSDFQLEAFRWTVDDGMIGLGDLPGGDFRSLATDVSVDGSVIIGESSSVHGNEAFRWRNGVMAGLGGLPGGSRFDTEGWSVSSDGSVIVGTSISSLGYEAFRWRDLNGNGLVDDDEKLDSHPEFGLGSQGVGGFVSSVALGVSADGSIVVGAGARTVEGPKEAFRWENGVMTGIGFLSGGGSGYYESEANGVSADGAVVVGHSSEAISVWSEAFRFTVDDRMVGLGVIPSSWGGSSALDLSADGSIAVGRSGQKAFIWDSTNGMRELHAVLTALGLDLTGWSLSSANGISDDGCVIVGGGYNPSGDQEAWIATLPGPCTNGTEVAHDRLIFSSFGPSNVVDSSRLATLGIDPQTGTDTDHAMSFTPSTDAKLGTVEVAVALLSGDNVLDILLVEDQSGSPGVIPRVIESFRATGAMQPFIFPETDATSNIVLVQSVSRPLLRAGTPYWLILSTPGPATTEAGWYDNSIGLAGRATRSQLDRPWFQDDSPTAAFRLAAPLSTMGTYSGSMNAETTNCTEPDDDNQFTLDGSIVLSELVEGSFVGDGTLTIDVGFICTLLIDLTGSQVGAQTLAGSFTETFRCTNGFSSSGGGSFQATIAAAVLTLSLDGQDTDISGTVCDLTAVFVPEPSAALVNGAALATLAALGASRRRCLRR